VCVCVCVWVCVCVSVCCVCCVCWVFLLTYLLACCFSGRFVVAVSLHPSHLGCGAPSPVQCCWWEWWESNPSKRTSALIIGHVAFSLLHWGSSMAFRWASSIAFRFVIELLPWQFASSVSFFRGSSLLRWASSVASAKTPKNKKNTAYTAHRTHTHKHTSPGLVLYATLLVRAHCFSSCSSSSLSAAGRSHILVRQFWSDYLPPEWERVLQHSIYNTKD
jgi:hypothetical protein